MKGAFTIVLSSLFFDDVNAAIVKFQQEVTDKKAMALPTYNSFSDWVFTRLLHRHLLFLTRRMLWTAHRRVVVVLRWTRTSFGHL
jgi:hypothetical protein